LIQKWARYKDNSQDWHKPGTTRLGNHRLYASGYKLALARKTGPNCVPNTPFGASIARLTALSRVDGKFYGILFSYLVNFTVLLTN